MAVKQIALAFREQFVGYLNVIGLEFDNIVAQVNAGLRGIGTWQSVAFLAGNFRASGTMSWTVPNSAVTTFEWCAFGKTLLIHLHVVSTTVGGTLDNQLKILVPGGYLALNQASGSYHYRDNGTYGTGLWSVGAGSTEVSFYRSDLTNWRTSASATDVRATLALSVQ